MQKGEQVRGPYHDLTILLLNINQFQLYDSYSFKLI